MSTDLWEPGTQIMWRYGQKLWRGDREAPHTAMPVTPAEASRPSFEWASKCPLERPG